MLNQRDDAGRVAGFTETNFVGEECGGDHALGYCFAVLVAAVMGDAFEGVAEGVAEIEDFAEVGFAFVAADDCGFDLGAAGD